MFSGWLKRYMPRGLFNRALLILVIPILLIQAVVTVIFIQRHFAGITRQMTHAIGLEIRYAIATAEAAPSREEALRRVQALGVPLGLTLELQPGQGIVPEARTGFFDVSGRAVVATLREILARPMQLDLVTDSKLAQVRVPTRQGVLAVAIPRRRVAASNPHLLLVWMLATSGILTGIAVLFLRNQVTPIRKLAQAAEEFGKGRTVRFRPRGAEEVRRAGAAFLAMRARIERQIEQRTRMLTGVSHDLRTPLTRMKLALAMAEPTPEMAEISRDVREMEGMLEAFLDFARGEGTEESEETDIGELVNRIVADAARSGQEVTLDYDPGPAGELRVMLRPLAVRRALQNLIDNAVKFAGTVRLTVRARPGHVEFRVEDDGPGIPADRREEVMRPFVRLDEARNQDVSAGVGLGLAIALDTARSHGGDLRLGESETMGGLRAELRIPR